MKIRKLLDSEYFREQADKLREDKIYHIVGENSIYVPSRNTSYINAQSCQEWPDLNGEVKLFTPGEIARMELERDFPTYYARARKVDFALLDINPPMYYNGLAIRGEMFYYDIRAAYAQLYRPLSIDFVHPRGLGTLALSNVAKRLYPHKVARNSVVGLARSKELTVFDGGRLIWQKYKNRWFCPALWWTIQAILHEIADVARRLQACYVATDGYIFTRWQQAGKFQRFLDEIPLDYRHFSGEGTISSWGSYAIDGFKRTDRAPGKPARINNIVEDKDGRRNLKWWMVINRQRTM